MYSNHAPNAYTYKGAINHNLCIIAKLEVHMNYLCYPSSVQEPNQGAGVHDLQMTAKEHINVRMQLCKLQSAFLSVGMHIMSSLSMHTHN